LAIANTVLSACAAMLVWMLIDLKTRGAITRAWAPSPGAVVGPCRRDAAAGFVVPRGALLIGAISTGVAT
jgi:ammonia channel protein AmtB